MKKYFVLLGLLFLSQLHFAQQKPSWEITELWDGILADWRNSIAFERTYDEQNRLLQQKLYIWRRTLGDWHIFSVRHYEYNNEGLISSYKRDYHYDYDAQIFNASEHTFYEYNSEGQLSLRTKQWINNVEETVNESTYCFKYDEDNCRNKYIYNDQLYSTSECNDQAMIVTESFYNGDVEKQGIHNYQYDDLANKMVIEYLNWDEETHQTYYTGTRFRFIDEERKFWYSEILQIEDYMDYDIESVLNDEGRFIKGRLQVFDKNTDATYNEVLIDRNFENEKLINDFIQVKDRNGNIIDERETIYNYDENDYLLTEQVIVTQFSDNLGVVPSIKQYEYNCEGLVSNYVLRLFNPNGPASVSRVSYLYDGIANCDEINPHQLTLFPNPTNGIFSVLDLSLNSTDMMLSIFDVKGVLIKQENTSCQGGRLEFDASDLPNGFYFVNINNGVINKTEKLLIAK